MVIELTKRALKHTNEGLQQSARLITMQAGHRRRRNALSKEGNSFLVIVDFCNHLIIIVRKTTAVINKLMPSIFKLLGTIVTAHVQSQFIAYDCENYIQMHMQMEETNADLIYNMEKVHGYK